MSGCCAERRASRTARRPQAPYRRPREELGPDPTPRPAAHARARPGPGASPVLSALDVSKSYDGAPLFDGLSLTLNAAERAGLVGPNGAGKSTLLRLLAGAQRADPGSLPPMGPIRPPPQG